MKRLYFHHLQIDWSAEGLPFDPVAILFELFLADQVRSPVEEAGEERPTDVRIELSLAHGEHIPDPASSGAVPLLCHGIINCAITEEGLSFWDGKSRIDIIEEGARIVGQIHPESFEDLFAVSEVMLLMTWCMAVRFHGFYHLHGGAVSMGPGEPTVLIAGDSGAGKSTSTLALLVAGGYWLSDDILYLYRNSADEIGVFPLPRPFHLTAKSLELFPSLKPFTSPGGAAAGRKWDMDSQAAFPGRQLHSSYGPFVLLFPEVVEAEQTRVIPISRAEALGRLLAATTWVTIEGTPEQMNQWRLLTDLVNRSACCAAHLGRDMLEEPTLLNTRLRECLAQ